MCSRSTNFFAAACTAAASIAADVIRVLVPIIGRQTVILHGEPIVQNLARLLERKRETRDDRPVRVVHFALRHRLVVDLLEFIQEPVIASSVTAYALAQTPASHPDRSPR